jgi:hypothetical protein
MKFKETNNTSYKRIKEIAKDNNCLALIPILWIGAFISSLIIYIFYAIYIIFNGIIKSIIEIFYAIYIIFNEIIKSIIEIFLVFLGIIKFFFSDGFWSYLLAYLQFNEEEYEIFEENIEDVHEGEQEQEDKHEGEQEQEDEQES